jgi:hypothetical protein
MSSQSCIICGPKRQSRALCNCCQQYLCRDHLKEHDDLLNAQLEPLADNINQLADRLQRLDIDLLIQPISIQLDQWKQSAFQVIERIYEEKLAELNQFTNQQVENLREQTKQIQIKVLEHIREQDATNEQIEFLFTKIQNIEKETNHIQHDPLQINIRPVILDDNYINFNSIKQSDDTLTPIIQTISSSPESVDCIASNDNHILLHRHPSLCLFDYNLNLIKQTRPCPELSIIDMCWSSTLNRFIILTDENVFSLDQTKMIIEKYNIPTRVKGHWHNVTSSSKYLYLTAYKWGSFIYQYNIIHSSSLQLNQKWETPLTCNKEESIDHFFWKNNQIAMIIQNRINNNKQLNLINVK